jgi:hypothetical protein
MLKIYLVFGSVLALPSMAGTLSADQQLAKSFLLPAKAPEPKDNPTTNLYIIITEYEAKLKYIYSMFMEYLRTIYIPEIVVKAFINIAEYSKFNIFNNRYVRNLLLIKNKFFYNYKIKKYIFNF